MLKESDAFFLVSVVVLVCWPVVFFWYLDSWLLVVWCCWCWPLKALFPFASAALLILRTGPGVFGGFYRETQSGYLADQSAPGYADVAVLAIQERHGKVLICRSFPAVLPQPDSIGVASYPTA